MKLEDKIFYGERDATLIKEDGVSPLEKVIPESIQVEEDDTLNNSSGDRLSFLTASIIQQLKEAGYKLEDTNEQGEFEDLIAIIKEEIAAKIAQGDRHETKIIEETKKIAEFNLNSALFLPNRFKREQILKMLEPKSYAINKIGELSLESENSSNLQNISNFKQYIEILQGCKRNISTAENQRVINACYQTGFLYNLIPLCSRMVDLEPRGSLYSSKLKKAGNVIIEHSAKIAEFNKNFAQMPNNAIDILAKEWAIYEDEAKLQEAVAVIEEVEDFYRDHEKRREHHEAHSKMIMGKTITLLIEEYARRAKQYPKAESINFWIDSFLARKTDLYSFNRLSYQEVIAVDGDPSGEIYKEFKKELTEELNKCLADEKRRRPFDLSNSPLSGQEGTLNVYLKNRPPEGLRAEAKLSPFSNREKLSGFWKERIFELLAAENIIPAEVNIKVVENIALTAALKSSNEEAESLIFKEVKNLVAANRSEKYRISQEQKRYRPALINKMIKAALDIFGEETFLKATMEEIATIAETKIKTFSRFSAWDENEKSDFYHAVTTKKKDILAKRYKVENKENILEKPVSKNYSKLNVKELAKVEVKDKKPNLWNRAKDWVKKLWR